jgi:hypothetical protein
MASKTSICNLAISHLGIDKEIGNVETENSAEARACRRFYEDVLKMTLRDYEWPFASKIAELSLIEEEPNEEWDYSYQYPSDCLMARKILSGIRNDTEDTKVVYELAYGDSGQVIFTDQDEAELKYTVYVDEPNRYPPDFIMAFSLYLASAIAPRIVGADKGKIADRAMIKYLSLIANAQSNARNEARLDVRPESEFVRGRE